MQPHPPYSAATGWAKLCAQMDERRGWALEPLKKQTLLHIGANRHIS